MGGTPSVEETHQRGEKQQLFYRRQRFQGGGSHGGQAARRSDGCPFTRGLRTMDIFVLPVLCSDSGGTATQSFRLPLFCLPVGVEPQFVISTRRNDGRGLSETD